MLDAKQVQAAVRKLVDTTAIDMTNPLTLRCGVYFLILKGSIHCIGQSKNIYLQIDQHEKVKVFDKVRIFHCAESDLDNLEGMLIRIFEPSDNNFDPERELNAPFSETFAALTCAKKNDPITKKRFIEGGLIGRTHPGKDHEVWSWRYCLNGRRRDMGLGTS